MTCAELELNYRTDYPNQGLALIFNLSFSDDIELCREGTLVDEERFVKSLMRLGFKTEDIRVKSDLTTEQIKQELTEAAEEYDHANNAMFVCAIFSYGTSKFLYDANSDLMLWSSLWENFTNDKCPSLKGKPKIFFIQACRGKEWDCGLKVKDNGEEDEEMRKKLKKLTKKRKFDMSVVDSKATASLSPYHVPHKRRRFISEMAPEDDEKQQYTGMRRSSLSAISTPVPKSWHEPPKPITTATDSIFKNNKDPFVPTHYYPDILVAASCAPEHYSIRNKKEGSWFIDTWCDVVMQCEDFVENDIIQLLTKVNCLVGVDKQVEKGEHKGKKQIPNINSTLTKRVYFKQM